MRIRALSILALISLVAALAAAATQKPLTPKDRDTYPWNKVGKKADPEVLDSMQGLWSLVSLRDPNLSEPNRTEVGFALIQGQHMAVEIHVGWRLPNEPKPLGTLRSGMHRFELGPGARLELTSLIGIFINREGDTKAERPGQERLYNLSVANDSLIMERTDGYKIEFRRVLGTQSRRDFFGRPVRKPEPEESDAGDSD